MSILLISYVIAGFWPKYFGVIVDPALRPPHPGWIIHAHVAVFLGWMLIFVMHALLAWADRSSSQARPLDGRLRSVRWRWVLFIALTADGERLVESTPFSRR
jgi:hypothetical protein